MSNRAQEYDKLTALTTSVLIATKKSELDAYA